MVIAQERVQHRAVRGKAVRPPVVAQLAPGKPVWINEVGCGDQGGDKSRWISDFINWLAGTDVGGLIWFDVDGNPDAPDWRLTTSASTTAAAKAALASW